MSTIRKQLNEVNNFNRLIAFLYYPLYNSFQMNLLDSDDCMLSILDGLVLNSKLVFFDFETTGLQPARDRIIEFGAVKIYKNNVIGEFSTLVDPKRELSAEIKQLCGLDDADLLGKPETENIIPFFDAFIQDAVLIGHNVFFDLDFYNSERHRCQMQKIYNPVLDTLALSKKCFKGQASYALQKLASNLDLQKNLAHRALDDAILCKTLFSACVTKMDNFSNMSVKDLITYSGTKRR